MNTAPLSNIEGVLYSEGSSRGDNILIVKSHSLVDDQVIPTVPTPFNSLTTLLPSAAHCIHSQPSKSTYSADRMTPTPSIPSRPTDKALPSSPPTQPAALSRNLPSRLSTHNSMPPPPRPALQTRTSSETQSHSLHHPQQTDSVPPHEEGEPSRIPTTFAPFFTLINDTSTQSVYHPTKIHYIFSDDDSSELLTSSLLTSLSSQQLPSRTRADAAEADANVDPESSLSLSSTREDKESGSTTTATSSSSSTTKFRRAATKRDEPQPPPRTSQRTKAGTRPPAAREERVLIVDVNESGDGVVSVSSLAPTWQVLNATIERAPTFDQAAAAAAAAGRAAQEDENNQEGLMLRIEGVGSLSGSSGSVRDKDGDAEGLGIGIGTARGKGTGGVDSSGVILADEEMAALLDGFDSKMAVLRRVVGAGEEFDALRETETETEHETGKEREVQRQGSAEPPEAG